MAEKYTTSFKNRVIELIEVSMVSNNGFWRYYIPDNHKEGTWEYETYGKNNSLLNVKPIGLPFIIAYDREKSFKISKLEHIGKSIDEIFLHTIIGNELLENNNYPIHLGVLNGYYHEVSSNVSSTIISPDKSSKGFLIVPYQFLTFE